ncbi:ribonuclease III [uncultured Propionivibrio sp.]|uniref:ribonuclease III n=1 Tax=uncultured Propionivibrio sp. TaxID=426737 RepID=UPI0029BFCD30|nr:ribonuclease III [uncultured Propionivibrio sp.]
MLQKLERSIGHHFHDALLFQTALTHRSHSSPHNERLEYLGDAALNAVVARLLFERFPDLPEGDLSRLRANLVRQESLHRIADQLLLGQFLRLGEGELRSGGATRPSILADAMEALFGAIWLDAGFEAVSAVIAGLYDPLIQAINPAKPMKDAKTRLQELLQSKRLPLPKYALTATEGEAHLQKFRIACVIEKLDICTEGQGPSRRAAEQMAAERALEKMDKS